MATSLVVTAVVAEAIAVATGVAIGATVVEIGVIATIAVEAVAVGIATK